MHFPRFFMLLLLSGSVLLQACGAAREEPFDPADPEPEPPEPVTVTLLIEDNENEFVPENIDRAIFFARDEEEYRRLQDIYMLANIERPDIPDLEAGVAVFYDGGVVDNRACAAKLILRNFDGEATTDDLVTLVLRHEHVVPDSNISCNGEPQEIRPYKVFYVPTSGDVIVREELR